MSPLRAVAGGCWSTLPKAFPGGAESWTTPEMKDRDAARLSGGTGPGGGQAVEEGDRKGAAETVRLMYASSVCFPYSVDAPS